MNENPDFEQIYYSTKAESLKKIGCDSYKILKGLAFYNRYNENINYLPCLIEKT